LPLTMLMRDSIVVYTLGVLEVQLREVDEPSQGLCCSVGKGEAWAVVVLCMVKVEMVELVQRGTRKPWYR